MRNEHSGILPFTLTEILTLLFFVLALALAFQSQRRAESEDRAESAEAKVEVLRVIEEALGTSDPPTLNALATAIRDLEAETPDDFVELVRELERRGSIDDQVRGALTEMGMSPEQAEQLPIDQALDSLAARIAETEESIQELIDSLGVTPAFIDSLDSSNETLAQELENVRGQLRNLQERAGNGLDHPPCWAAPDGEIEYMFDVTLQADEIDVVAVWPPHRDAEAQTMPGVLELADRTVSLGEFARLSAPILTWSQHQDPECRHFVSIFDGVGDGPGAKDAFQEGLLTVEHAFYKRAVGWR